MHSKTHAPILFLCAMLLASCAETPGEITRDTKPFDGISEAASISAAGTEPFWSLSIDPVADGYKATYATPEQSEGVKFPLTRFAGNNGLGFSGEADGQSVSLALTPGECSDMMSERIYPYTATLAMGELTLFGCAYTSDEPFIGDENP